jgi:hypothetical protein
MIILVVASTLSTSLPSARAVSVAITSLTPSSGKVGTTVRIIGTINNTDGSYRIWFAQQMIKNGTASGNSVNATFLVPAVTQANYTITLQDVVKNINATKSFQVVTAFYISTIMVPTSPGQLQENSTVGIQVNATGGKENTVYSANITVETPTPSNVTYWTLVRLNTSATGNGAATVFYQNGTKWTSGTPDTNLTGTYDVAFNKTIATTAFTVGLTNSTQYHRYQTVGIKAAGYKLNETVMIKITFGGKTINSTSVNATQGGLILADWPVPENASVGTYTLNLTSVSSISPTKKTVPDVQNFIVPGFSVNMTTENLAKETVQGVKVQVFENGKSVANVTSGSNGLAQIKLEIGSYTYNASYKNTTVNEGSINITNAVSFVLYCNLTNLKVSVIAVKDGNPVNVPGAKIHLTRENETLTTDLNGTAIAQSLLPNVDYTLNASRYGVSFNVTTLSSLLVNQNVTAWYNISFTLPEFTLLVNVTNAKREPVPNALVKAEESMGGLIYNGTANSEGIADLSQCVFGRYTITVYDAKGIKLNETTVSVLNLTLPVRNISISCKLAGLTISVKVVDYLGHSISNVKVALQQDDLASLSNLTQADGVATFDDVSGGNIQITIYLSGQTQPYMAEGLYLANSTTVGIKLEKYVILAGFLVETSSLITALLIVATLILVLLVEVYRRRRAKPQQKPESEPK